METNTKNPGTIFQTPDGGFGIGYIKEQLAIFGKKVMIAHFEDADCTIPKIKGASQKRTLISLDKLTQIGFVD